MRNPDRNPNQLYHGTTVKIHELPNSFLDPRRAKGRDEGDPTTPHVFATPYLMKAELFAFKTEHAASILSTRKGQTLIYKGVAPDPEAEGVVYKLKQIKGFKETMRRDKPSGQWAMLAEDMPLVTDQTGEFVRGIPLIGTPVKRVTLPEISEKYAVRIFVIPDGTDLVAYKKAVRDSLYEHNEDRFLEEAENNGRIQDITGLYRRRQLSRDQTIDLELLAERIITHWKTPSEINWDTIILDEGNINQAQNESGLMYYY